MLITVSDYAVIGKFSLPTALSRLFSFRLPASKILGYKNAPVSEHPGQQKSSAGFGLPSLISIFILTSSMIAHVADSRHWDTDSSRDRVSVFCHSLVLVMA